MSDTQSNHERTLQEFRDGRKPQTATERAAGYRSAASAVRATKPNPEQTALMLEQWAEVQEVIAQRVTVDRSVSAGWIIGRIACAHQLTERERDILTCVLEGSTSPEIATRLEISRATVKWHMHNIFAKTLTSSRESLLRMALQIREQT